ncbi:hypothetical protein BDU57DRAFT_557086 [Ampelomyces quisqualis]|uniref:Uncharacterized protein n=1 Tax=Ampelomyces quisqualis TaxID=50730 RepID=A0A6A5QQ51_AMPQU|nr:hypothetical protein BDU57DRAFT_557086 [Ampelomyces quisqualis]
MNNDLTATQQMQIARIEYLNARSMLLRNFLKQCLPDRRWMENPRDPVRSGNGDIKSDFALLERLTGHYEKEEFKKVLRLLYGTCCLTMRSETTATPSFGLSESTENSSVWNGVKSEQSIVQLKRESARSMQQARQPIPRFPHNIIENSDMVVILNARATVLLNASFRELRQQKQIIKLAALALKLWRSRTDHTEWADVMSDLGTTDEERAWIILYLLQLIRDDVYQCLNSAIQEFHNTEGVEQKRHIDVFRESANTWRKLTNRRNEAARGCEHPIESKHRFDLRIIRSRHY